MTDFNELVGITVNSLIINDDKTCLVFRSNENVLYFYESEFVEIRGVDMFDDKYGNINGYEIIGTESFGDHYLINFREDYSLSVKSGTEIKCAGVINENVLKDAHKFSQLVEDF